MSAPERALRVVRVDHANVVETKNAVRFKERFLQSIRARYVVTGSQKMTRIETEADRQMGDLGREIPDDIELLEAAAELRASADGIFDEKLQLFEFQSLRGESDAFEKIQQTLLDRLPAIVAGMRHQIVRADGDRALQLSPKRHNRLRTPRFPSPAARLIR